MPLATGKFCVATLKMISFVDPKFELINKIQCVLLQSYNAQKGSVDYRCNLSDWQSLMNAVIRFSTQTA